MTFIVFASTLPTAPLVVQTIGRSAAATPPGMTYADNVGCHIDRESSSAPEKLSCPSAVFSKLPSGIVAAKLGAKRDRVTMPVAATAGRRVKPKSAIQESRSPSTEVAARVVCKTCKTSHCNHRTTDAFASKIARTTEPTETSTSAV